MTAGLQQADCDDLSAYLDGELSDVRAVEVARLVRDDPVWRAAHAELRALDAAMDAWTVPAPPEGLAQRVLASVRRRAHRPLLLRTAAWLGPLAAAAAVALLAVAIMNRPSSDVPGRELGSSRALAPVPKAERADVERMIVENLGFFSDYEVLEEMETLQALDELEREGT
jgi:hypothetical protein